MQKDDVPTFWKTLAPNKSQSIGAKQLACPPFPMGIDIRCIVRKSEHHPEPRESEQTTVVGKAMRATNSP